MRILRLFLFLTTSMSMLLGTSSSSFAQKSSGNMENYNPPPMENTDPNRDPNWDWLTNQTYTFYYFDDSNPAQTTPIPLPYYTPNDGPSIGGLPKTVFAQFDNNGNFILPKDLSREEGWELFFRDFGSPGRHTNLIHYILYNRYKGTLRFFVFEPKARPTYNHAEVVVSFRALGGVQTTEAPPLFTHFDDSHCFVDDYNRNLQQASLTKLNGSTSTGWWYADVNVTGYDRDWQRRSTLSLIGNTGNGRPLLRYEIGYLTVSQVDLSGRVSLNGKFTLPPAENDRISSILNMFGSAFEVVSAINGASSFEKNIGKNIEIETGTESPGPLAAIKVAVYTTKIIKSFIGLFKDEKPQTIPISLEGTAELSGTVITPFSSGVIRQTLLPIPGVLQQPIGSEIQAPLYTRGPLGVVSMRSKPVAVFGYNLRQYFSTVRNSIDFDFNPYSGLRLVKSESRLIHSPWIATSLLHRINHNESRMENPRIDIALSFIAISDFSTNIFIYKSYPCGEISYHLLPSAEITDFRNRPWLENYTDDREILNNVTLRRNVILAITLCQALIDYHFFQGEV
jgi:hypothetical protein